MQLRCFRLKKIYVKTYLVLSVILFAFLFITKLNSKKYSGTFTLDSNITDRFEAQLRDYESKIIPKLGDNGEPAVLEGKDAAEGEESLKKYALNAVLSDRMPLDRKIRDPRHKK